MSTVLALGLAGLMVWAAVAMVRWSRRMPVTAALPLAFAVIVVFEGLALPALSLVGAVTPIGIALAQGPLLVAGYLAACASPRVSTGSIHLPRPAKSALWWIALAPLLALIVSSAVLYPPNTWDAMTYHLARVAHWLDNHSVAAYPTWNPRQNVFPPGAAYLMLVLQGISTNERLAAFVQLGSWVVLAVGTARWARRFGAPRSFAVPAAMLVATLPMAVLQASSTQYDLVAAVLMLAVAEACLPFIHGRPGWRDGIQLGIAIAGALLVKTSALVAAAPFAGYSAVVMLRRAPVRRILAAAPGVVAVPATLMAVELLRRRTAQFEPDLTAYVYPAFGEWLDRSVNSVRALSHHLPIAGWLAAITPSLAPLSGTSLGAGAMPFRPDESYIGNPLQASLFLIAVISTALCWRRLPARVRIGVLWPLVAWLLLHALARDNSWISRLETPVFVIGTLGAVAAMGAVVPSRRIAQAAAASLVVCSLAYAVAVAARNERRPPTLTPAGEEARYSEIPQLRPIDEATLRIALERRCDRLGSRLASPDWLPDPWDYPLTWAAYRAGIHVRHVNGNEAWPCVLHTLTPPPPSNPRWTWSGEELTFVR